MIRPYGTVVFLLCLHSPHRSLAARSDVAGGGRDEELSVEKSPVWYQEWGDCQTTCGESTWAMKLSCRNKGTWTTVDESLCEKEPKPKTSKCKELKGCGWYRDDTIPKSLCGYATPRCVETSTGLAKEQALCDESEHLPTIEEFQAKQGRYTSGCDEVREWGLLLNSVCTTTINYPKGLTGKDVVDIKEASHVVSMCDKSADVIVLNTQELTHSTIMLGNEMVLKDNYADYVEKADQIEGYTRVATCGGSISPAVLVLVADSKLGLVASLSATCKTFSANDGSNTNIKGSVVASISTVQGVFAFGCTHGHRGGTISKERVELVRSTAQHILDTKPAMISWGGDFNPRTVGDVATDTRVHGLGMTHPASDVVRDDFKSLKDKYDPASVREALAAMPDILGLEGRTFAEEIKEASEGRIAFAPGHHQLCPTYYKQKTIGSEEMVVVPGTGTKVKMFGFGTRFGQKEERGWVPNFACQVDAEAAPEYYMGNLKKWKGKSAKPPSWPDRILVSSGMVCQNVQKIIAETDHDALYVNCDIPGGSAPLKKHFDLID